MYGEMLSRFYFFLIRDRPFGFLVERGAVFFNSLELEIGFQTKCKKLFFVTIKSLFYNCN